MGAVVGYGESLHDSCLVGFNSLGFHQFYAVVALWEGNGLSIRLRWVRFPSTAPNYALFFQWIGYLATNEEMVVRFHHGAPTMGAVVGYGDSWQESCLQGFNSLGFHQFNGALSVVACTSCCDRESMSSILIEHPKTTRRQTCRGNKCVSNIEMVFKHGILFVRLIGGVFTRPDIERLNAQVAQLVEATDSKPVKCGFESLLGHQYKRP